MFIFLISGHFKKFAIVYVRFDDKISLPFSIFNENFM